VLKSKAIRPPANAGRQRRGRKERSAPAPIISKSEKMSSGLPHFYADAEWLFFVRRSTEIAANTLRSSTMKRILSALIASIALFAAASGAALAAAPSQCNGPASYCNVFFGN
jgi:hypothetical protein